MEINSSKSSLSSVYNSKERFFFSPTVHFASDGGRSTCKLWWMNISRRHFVIELIFVTFFRDEGQGYWLTSEWYIHLSVQIPSFFKNRFFFFKVWKQEEEAFILTVNLIVERKVIRNVNVPIQRIFSLMGCFFWWIKFQRVTFTSLPGSKGLLSSSATTMGCAHVL